MTREEALEGLERCRKEIDGIDLQILNLLNERTRIVQEIGHIKQLSSLPIYEPRREDQVFENVASHNTGPLSPDGVKRVFERITDEMRRVQRQRMETEQAKGGKI